MRCHFPAIVSYRTFVPFFALGGIAEASRLSMETDDISNDTPSLSRAGAFQCGAPTSKPSNDQHMRISTQTVNSNGSAWQKYSWGPIRHQKLHEGSCCHPQLGTVLESRGREAKCNSDVSYGVKQYLTNPGPPWFWYGAFLALCKGSRSEAQEEKSSARIRLSYKHSCELAAVPESLADIFAGLILELRFLTLR